MSEQSNIQLPSDITLKNAAKIALQNDKPILLDYYTDSLNGKAIIGVRGSDERKDKEKLLVKSAEEYTSTISKTFKCGDEYIVVTENSIYIVSANIPTKIVR